ncbi:MAG: hypothetical protein OIN87_08390 [Candidatus Methanoperedens sp.]|nr:hypothetical protein [Candidatus Methanoperedens sp.]
MHTLKLQEIRARIKALKNDNSVLCQPGVQRDNELRRLEEWRAELLTIMLDDLEQEGLDFVEVAATIDDLSIILARVARRFEESVS